MAKAEEAAQLIRDRKVAYGQLFAGDGPAKYVLADIAKFCREKESCFHVDPRAHAVLEGRREVILRIRDYLDLDVEELVKKYGGKNG